MVALRVESAQMRQKLEGSRIIPLPSDQEPRDPIGSNLHTYPRTQEVNNF